jgi:hypothetical protein
MGRQSVKLFLKPLEVKDLSQKDKDTFFSIYLTIKNILGLKISDRKQKNVTGGGIRKVSHNI